MRRREVQEFALLVVAQAFKETLTASQVADAMTRGIRGAGIEPRVLLGSDGGDGLLEALERAVVRRTEHQVEGPLGTPVQAPAAWLDEGSVVVESRYACGLALLQPDQRDPLRTSSRGVGTLVSRLAAEGARQIFVGLGGSATVDGGVGMARAWGWVPRDSSGVELSEGGGALIDLRSLDRGGSPPVRITGLCDVQNPLVGPRGARIYAAQKGAAPTAVERLAAGLDRLAAVAGAQGGAALAERPGSGAAGGLGFGILFFGRGTLIPGAPWVLERVGFSSLLARSALVVTGEGAFDETSLEGKLTGEVMRRARDARIPVLLLAPRARAVPEDVMVETGGKVWTAAELERRTYAALRRHFGLLGK